jgi:hypothetical protein
MKWRVATPVILVCVAAGCVVEPLPANHHNAPPAGNVAGGANASNVNVSPAVVADEKLRDYAAGVARGLAPEMREALEKLDGDARRLLAIRGYLRGRSDLGARWAWSEQQIAEYKGSAEYAVALAEVEKVRAKFAELNPGYTLHVNTEVRSLDAQARNWNEADSVRRAGEELLAAASRELSKSDYKPAPDRAGLASFERFLRGYRTATTPSVAAPGLSPHGQLRAFDFQVRRGDELIAGTSSAAARRDWDETGWAKKLSEAVGKASTRFNGPLQSPYEPWHYTYAP